MVIPPHDASPLHITIQLWLPGGQLIFDHLQTVFPEQLTIQSLFSRQVMVSNLQMAEVQLISLPMMSESTVLIRKRQIIKFIVFDGRIVVLMFGTKRNCTKRQWLL